MKVVQLVMARQYRGAELFAAQLSRELITSGVDVRYVSLYRTHLKNNPVIANEVKQSRFSELKTRLLRSFLPRNDVLSILEMGSSKNGNGFKPEGVEYYDLQGSQGSIISISLLYKLRKFLTQFKPDIVQANAGNTLKYAVLVKLLFGLKFKIVYRNASLVSRYMRSARQKMFNSFLYRRVDYILSVSEMSRRDMEDLFPFTKGKIAVVPNAVRAIPFAKVNDFDNEKINLVHVGGFTFEKNHEGLLRIFKKVKNSKPDCILWLIGDGALKVEIEKKVFEKGLGEHVRFVGPVSNPLDYIHSADVLVLPSLIEGLPAVILEAFYCKTPVVAYDVGGISEVVKPGETGWLIKADNEEGFVSATLQVLQADGVDTIVENAYNLVVSEFDNKIIAKRFLKVYKNIF